MNGKEIEENAARLYKACNILVADLGLYSQSLKDLDRLSIIRKEIDEMKNLINYFDEKIKQTSLEVTNSNV